MTILRNMIYIGLILIYGMMLMFIEWMWRET